MFTHAQQAVSQQPDSSSLAAAGSRYVSTFRSTERLLADGAQALWHGGDLRRSRDLFETAYRRALREENPGATASAVLGQAGLWVHEYQSMTAAAVALDRLRRAAQSADPARDGPLALRLRARLAAEADHRSAGHGAILAVVEEARRAADPIAVAEALNLAHQCLMAPGHGPLRLRVAHDLIAESARTRRPGDLVLGSLWRTVDGILCGSADARGGLDQLRALLSSRPHLAALHCARAIEVMFAIRAGRFEHVERLAQECADAGAEAGQSAAATWHAAHLIATRWYQGRITELLPLVRRVAAAPNLSPVDYSFQAWLALACAAAGEDRQARATLAGLTGHGQSLAAVPRSGSWLVALYGVVEAAYLLGDRETAQQAYQLLLPYAALPAMAGPAVTCFGSVEHALGIAQLTLGRNQAAAGHLTRAVDHNAVLGHFPAAALARHRLAAALDDGHHAESAQRDAAELGMTLPIPPATHRTDNAAATPTCQRHGRDWHVHARGRTIEVEHCRGLAYLAVLLANPGREIPALDLAAGPGHAAGAPAADLADPAAPTSRAPAAQPLLDERAVRQYRQRLNALLQEIEDCGARGDGERAARARAEHAWLHRQLHSAAGLAGRPRAFPSDRERARVAVGKAIRRALARIAEADAEIGLLLAAGVRTGLRCSYVPGPAADAATAEPEPA